MRIATWNVNSIRTRVGRVIDFLARANVDVLAMQETKCRPDQFPREAFAEAGYRVEAIGHNQWNGVAIAAREGLPMNLLADELPGAPKFGEPARVEARALGCRVDGVEVWSLYVPNGRELDHPHYAYKLEWFAALEAQVKRSLAVSPSTLAVFGGDFNVAPLDSDVWDMAEFAGATHVSAPEREAFGRLLEAGLVDSSREHAPGYSYWDYQRLRFQRGQGMRIDFMLTSPALAARCTGGSIDAEERKGKGASDHVPVILDFA